MENYEKKSRRLAVRNDLDLNVYFTELAILDKLPYKIKIQKTDSMETATISVGDLQRTFDLIFLLNTNAAKVQSIAVERASAANPPLLVVPNLKAHFYDLCRRLRVSAIDLNGRSLITGSGIYIETPRLPNRNFRAADDPGDIFKGKSVRIIRTLLSNRLQEWQQSEIAARTGATQGLVSRVARYLRDYGVLQRVSGRRIRVCDHQRLLDMWLKSADVQRGCEIRRFATLASDKVQLARNVAATLEREAIDFAFTQWIAGWLRHPYTEPAVVSLYVHALPPQNVIEGLSLVPVSNGGNVWFLIAPDGGVLLEKQNVDGMPLVTDAQIVVDLDGTGLRGPEQAKALREWDSFCIPPQH